jgi:hypothetical protein
MPCLKYHCLFFILCLLPVIAHAQSVYEGQVINSVTQEPLNKATVTLLKAKQATATNQQGYFRLIVDQPIITDTLAVSFVGFKTYYLPLSAYQENIFIRLTPAINQLEQVNIGSNKAKTVVLEKFNYADVRDLRGPFEYYFTQPYHTLGLFAKQFEAPADGTILTIINLGRRLAYDIPAVRTDMPHVSTNKLTRFLLHVMTADTVSGTPGKKLFTKEITLNDNSLMITFDLSKEKITLPNKSFFIAIEWVPAPINEVVRLAIGKKVDKTRNDGTQKTLDVSRYYIMYQPFLVIIPRPNKTPTWASPDGTTWSKLKQRSEIALSATVTY